MRIIVSGGGTAGHIYPALAVAKELQGRGHEILFVGASGKMEMLLVPKEGFDIEPLPVVGLVRRLTWKNFRVPFMLLSSLVRARVILRDFEPDMVVGFGGYASSPTLFMAQIMGIATIIQEQNSYAGLTNRILSKGAKRICVAYSGMERFFGNRKIVYTGNPLRVVVPEATDGLREEAYRHFSLDPVKKTILVMGGSLGALTLNEAVIDMLGGGSSCNDASYEGGFDGVQLLWQTGGYYDIKTKRELDSISCTSMAVVRLSFIERMDYAYCIADLVICRSGASTVSELSLLSKAVLFVPSPNVAEDHQTKNAMALVGKEAAIIVKDVDAKQDLFSRAMKLLSDDNKLATMRFNIKELSTPNATRDIADVVEVVASSDNHRRGTKAKATSFSVFNSQKGSGSGVESKGRVYFVGIGGIGMSALARFFNHEGYRVAGYDRTKSPLTEALEREGIDVHYEDSVNNIPIAFRFNHSVDTKPIEYNISGDSSGCQSSTSCCGEATTASSYGLQVIFTPAIPKDSEELNYFLNRGVVVLKRSEALGMLCNDKYLMAVSGTHGKTTTSTMAALFNSVGAGEGNALLGGIAKNFSSNLVLDKNSNRMVVEADEFDRSFHQLTPDVAVITCVSPDHLDIYNTPEAFHRAFEIFIERIKTGGSVIIHKDVSMIQSRDDITYLSYSLDDISTDYYAQNITLLEGGYYSFDIVTPSQTISNCRLGITGLINVENCIGAVALVDIAGFDSDNIKRAISDYQGVARRFDIWINTAKLVYMDDYAHHPDEIRALLSSTRAMFPRRKITIVFQPHLYSRTLDFAEAFAETLSMADHVIILPIYPARELPIDGVSSALIYDRITTIKEFINKEDLEERIKTLDVEVLITAGAGDIGRHCDAISTILKIAHRSLTVSNENTIIIKHS